eukprot:6327763-Karenia_brevis.AAC.1
MDVTLGWALGLPWQSFPSAILGSVRVLSLSGMGLLVGLWACPVASLFEFEDDALGLGLLRAQSFPSANQVHIFPFIHERYLRLGPGHPECLWLGHSPRAV